MKHTLPSTLSGALHQPAPASTASLRSWLAPLKPWLPGIPALLFLAVFFLWPVGEILLNSFKTSDGPWGLQQDARLAAEPTYAKVIGTTFLVSLIVAVVSVLIAFPLAYLLSQIPAERRSRWFIWLLIPFWTSYLIKTFAWVLLLSRTGVIGVISKMFGGEGVNLSVIPSLAGVLIGMVHALVPLAVVSMLPIMQGIGTQLPSAAQTLGAGRRTAFLTVFLPLSLPGLAAAGLLVFITSLGFFIVPALLGSPKETMVAQVIISVILELFNMPFAGALSAVLLVATIIVFVGYDRAVGLSSIGGAPSSRAPSGVGSQYFIRIAVRVGLWLDSALARRGPASARVPSGLGLKAYGVVLIALLVLPTMIVVPISFTSSSFLSFPPQGFSLRWYETFATSPIWQAAMLRSVLVATLTALGSVAMGLGAALMLAKVAGKSSNAIFAFLVAPLILPRIVIAVGLFYLFARMNLIGTEAGLVIGHTVLAIPYVVVTLAAALKRYDWRLDDAARILGASPFARIRTVMIPILLPSMASAFLLAFLTSFDELTIAIFVSGGLSTTLPKQMWDDMVLQVNPTLAAVSTALLLVVSLIVLALSLTRSTRDTHE
jgi:ABC-type spermidine/putrescine transport system permease subunit II